MESIKDYINVSPQSKISNEAVFIWIDILGFSAIVDDDEQYHELLVILNEFQKLFEHDLRYHSTVISDGIILEIKLTTHGELVETLKEIGNKQLNFIIKNKVFLRGGIAVGNKLENKDNNTRFISNGLSRAVKIENKTVEYPLIGTNKKTIESLNKILKISNEDLFSLKTTFNTKGEVVYYIDFISEPNDDYYCLLCENIEKNREIPNILKKYVWLLKHYHHNFMISKHCPSYLKEAIL